MYSTDTRSSYLYPVSGFYRARQRRADSEQSEIAYDRAEIQALFGLRFVFFCYVRALPPRTLSIASSPSYVAPLYSTRLTRRPRSKRHPTGHTSLYVQYHLAHTSFHLCSTVTFTSIMTAYVLAPTLCVPHPICLPLLPSTFGDRFQ